MLKFLKEKNFIAFQQITKSEKSVFVFGLIAALIVTLKEVIGKSYNTFQIYSYGSIDFWADNNPYLNWHHLSILGKPLDVFIYEPLFSVLFTPFTFFPSNIGVILWNAFNYSLFAFAILKLPKPVDFKQKKFIFFFSLLLLFNTLLSVQLNPAVVASFLFSFSLLEKKRGFLAVLLMLLSGFTKIYGIFQLIMLLFYPNFWKNVLYAVIISIALLLLPLIHLPFNELIFYYQSWIHAVINHSTNVLRFYSIYRPIYSIYPAIKQIRPFISFAFFGFLIFLAILNLDFFKKSIFNRLQYLGILMSWLILFGLSTEKHTYVIAVVGYVIWYLNSTNRTKFDTILLWTNFVFLEILPIDIICPPAISNFILGKLSLGIFIFAFTWSFMVYKTFFKVSENNSVTKSLCIQKLN